MFVFPIPLQKEKAYRSILFQARDKIHLYTDLEQFKQKQEQSIPSLSCAFYTEFQKTKGLVLMRGKINLDALNPNDAALLGNQTTIWYFDDERYQFVYNFNHKPNSFNFEKVIEYMTRL